MSGVKCRVAIVAEKPPWETFDLLEFKDPRLLCPSLWVIGHGYTDEDCPYIIGVVPLTTVQENKEQLTEVTRSLVAFMGDVSCRLFVFPEGDSHEPPLLQRIFQLQMQLLDTKKNFINDNGFTLHLREDLDDEPEPIR
jgi:hypothetical protein